MTDGRPGDRLAAGKRMIGGLPPGADVCAAQAGRRLASRTAASPVRRHERKSAIRAARIRVGGSLTSGTRLRLR
jgi:hypothetical protein